MLTGLRHMLTGLRHMLTGLRHMLTGLRHMLTGLRHMLTGLRHAGRSRMLHLWLRRDWLLPGQRSRRPHSLLTGRSRRTHHSVLLLLLRGISSGRIHDVSWTGEQ